MTKSTISINQNNNLSIKNITKKQTTANNLRNNRLLRSGLATDIVEIDFNLAATAKAELSHRKFACFLKLTTNDTYIEITTSSLSEDIKKVEESYQNLVNAFFSEGGNSLTVYNNTVENVGALENIEAFNLLFFGNTPTEQLALYKAIPSSITANKFLHFSTDSDFKEDNYPISRNTFIWFAESNTNSPYLFAYFAPYTEELYYRKNNFEIGSYKGMSVSSLDFIKKNNLAAYLYIPEFKQSMYVNVVDSTSVILNADFLREDLKYYITNNVLSALANRNYYDNTTLATINNVIAEAAQKFIDLNLITEYTTSYKSLAQQDAADITAQIARGFILNYAYKGEINQVNIQINELTKGV